MEIARLFPTMKKLFNIANTRVASETELSSQPANVSAVIDKYGGHIDLALLQFFLNHSEAVVYDPEPLFRNFFQNFIGNNCILFLVEFSFPFKKEQKSNMSVVL